LSVFSIQCDAQSPHSAARNTLRPLLIISFFGTTHHIMAPNDTLETGSRPGISQTEDPEQPVSATQVDLPSGGPASSADIPEVVSRGPNPTIATHVRYCVYANVQKENNTDVIYKRLTNRGHLPPCNLDYKNLSLSLMKALVFDHLRTESRSKYPIDMVAIQAERALALEWYYSVEEPNDVAEEPTSPTHIWTFEEFVQAAVSSSAASKVTIYLNVLEDTIEFQPCAIVTLVVKV
jgi:hypothetical protein